MNCGNQMCGRCSTGGTETDMHAIIHSSSCVEQHLSDSVLYCVKCESERAVLVSRFQMVRLLITLSIIHFLQYGWSHEAPIGADTQTS